VGGELVAVAAELTAGADIKRAKAVTTMMNVRSGKLKQMRRRASVMGVRATADAGRAGLVDDTGRLLIFCGHGYRVEYTM